MYYEGAVSIAFEAMPMFKNYHSGVYVNRACSKSTKLVNHAVVVVGYGLDSNTNKPYWIVKNSWGPDWGINGYFWILKGSNECGLALCASQPLIELSSPSDYDQIG